MHSVEGKHDQLTELLGYFAHVSDYLMPSTSTNDKDRSLIQGVDAEFLRCFKNIQSLVDQHLQVCVWAGLRADISAESGLGCDKLSDRVGRGDD